MWYQLAYPATWAGFNTFLSGVSSLFSSTSSAIMGQPVLLFFLAALLLLVVYWFLLLICHTAKRM